MVPGIAMRRFLCIAVILPMLFSGISGTMSVVHSASHSSGNSQYFVFGQSAGIYVGNEGAVVATGVGEEIIKRILCYNVYLRINEDSLLDVLREEISGFTDPVGLIAVNRKEHAWHANRQMSTGTSVKK